MGLSLWDLVLLSRWYPLHHQSLPVLQRVFDVRSGTPFHHTPETPSITEEAKDHAHPSRGKLLNNRGHASGKGTGPGHPEALARLLVSGLMNSDCSWRRLTQPANHEHIIIETELDGARYVLVRLPNPGRPSVRLSPREQQIVGMVAQGQPNKIIAAGLNISPWTVNTHLRRIFAKLDVGTRAAMVARFVASPDISGLVRFQTQ